MRLFSIASVLALHSAALAAGPWQCENKADEFWDCVSREAATIEPGEPATTGTEPPATAADTPPAVIPVVATPEPQAEARTDTDGDTALFPTVAPEVRTPAAVEPDKPAATPAATEPVSGTDSTPSDATESVMTVTESEAPPATVVTETEAPVATALTAAASTLATTTVADTRDVAIDGESGYSRRARCPPVQYRTVDTPTATTGAIELQADNAQARDKNIFTLEGNAVAHMDWQRLEADSISYNQDEGRIDASGNVLYTSPELVVDGERGTLYPDTDSGDIEQARYALPQQHARGTASSMELDGRERQHLEDVTYTTCQVSSNDWQILAKQVDLDQQEGRGTARHARVELKGVPVFYSPWMSFPLDDRRKSGLLIPRVGATEETGVDISVPYYWNIAPDKDATIIPRFMSDRGVMLGGEFRYRNRTNSGELRGEFLSSDKKFDNDNRYLVSFNHRGRPTPRLETSIRASDVSDDFYFNDFGTNLIQTSQTNLERTATAAYHGRGWNLGFMVQNYQTIDPTIPATSRPYEQLPRVALDVAPAGRLLGLKFDADAEANYFRHSGGVLVEGSRFDIQPRLSLPVNHPGWYVDPSVSVRYTAYNLNNTAAGKNNNPSRTTPVVSLDAGSVFERNSRWGGTDFVQTLEPRLFYLYVPDVDQDEIPVFDTGEYDFNLWTLFRDNRFSGPDRMGDANQLALALTSRLLNPASGIQQFSVSVGSLLYFRDRNVTLPGKPVETDNSSNIIGELSLALPHNWRARAETQWNPHASRSERNSFHLQYRKGSRQLINLAYRFRRDIQEQTDISMLWPLGNSWHMVGRWYYSLKDGETLEALAGLGYESCCWTVQVVGRSYIKSLGTRTNAIFVQVELKGLGKLVNTVDKALERGILGYESFD